MRLKRLYEKVQKKEDVTIAFIGGSITQGAGATPIHEGCYARRTYEGFFALMKDLTGTQPDRDHVHFRKVGVGGTPSELGMIRYERDILKNGEIEPDLVVVEFAVNDTEDETQGECYESLVKTILLADNQPAVILLFSVFADNWNLQDRLAPIGQAYDLPMVSVKDAVAKQFDELSDERIVTRNQYFYDKLHPSNIGHDIMADSLLYLLKAAYEAPDVPEKDIRKVVPVIGDRFVNTHLLDRKDTYDKAVISPGSFTETDTRLQAVEMDFDFGTTGEFPYNWMHTAGSEPFTMKITCRSLVLVMKDSEGADSGKAEVKVDGKLVLTADPKVVGWVHCHPMILFIGDKEEEHLIEINMIPGDEDKAFTILGFGYTQESL
ncbi:MAG: SGNH/GDSL hydrolase family protein [Lachnospiraceae bacterium]|nr:SGNH/GDSL hydrolase family protein [Lachnospiraceae bacterium]